MSSSFPAYVVRKLIVAFILILLVLTLSFAILELGPIGLLILPPRGICGPSFASQVAVEWGLGQPAFVRYGIYLGNILRGDLGPTFILPGCPSVTQVLTPSAGDTVTFAGVAVAVSAALGFLLGTWMRRRRGRARESAVFVGSMLPFALAWPLLAVAVVLIFGVFGSYNPANPAVNPWARFLDYGWHLISPVLVIVATTFGLFAWSVRNDRGNPPEEPPAPSATSPSVRARLRSGLRALRRESPRALPGVSTYLGWILSEVFLVESVFNREGIGSLLYRSRFAFDPFLLSGIFVLSAIGVIIVTTATDVVHAYLTRNWTSPRPTPPESVDVSPRGLLWAFKSVIGRPIGSGGLAMLIFVLAFIGLGPVLAGSANPLSMAPGGPFLQPPSAGHPLGTDSFGRDVWVFLAYGGTPFYVAGLLGFTIALLSGLGIAAAISFYGNWIDDLLAIPADFFLVLPWLPLALLLTFPDPDLSPLVFLVLGWPIAARLLRHDLRGLTESAEARRNEPRLGKGRGSRSVRRLWAMGPSIAGNALMASAFAIIIEEVIASPPTGFAPPLFVSWSTLIEEWLRFGGLVQGFWWLVVPPALCIGASVLAPILVAVTLKDGTMQDRNRKLGRPRRRSEHAVTPKPE